MDFVALVLGGSEFSEGGGKFGNGVLDLLYVSSAGRHGVRREHQC